jgi:hypothetical protein
MPTTNKSSTEADYGEALDLHQIVIDPGCNTGQEGTQVQLDLKDLFWVVTVAGTTFRIQLSDESDVSLQDFSPQHAANPDVARISHAELQTGQEFTLAIGDTAMSLVVVQTDPTHQTVQLGIYCAGAEPLRPSQSN